jgi:integration host factor subunit alpha
MPLTKSDLIASLSNDLNIPKSKSSALVESILETIKATLAPGEDVLISGFGKFHVKKRESERGETLTPVRI